MQAGPGQWDKGLPERLELERYGDVAALHTALSQAGQHVRKTIQCHPLFGVLNGLPRQFGKTRVYQGRLAVFDRVTQYAVVVHGVMCVERLFLAIILSDCS